MMIKTRFFSNLCVPDFFDPLTFWPLSPDFSTLLISWPNQLSQDFWACSPPSQLPVSGIPFQCTHQTYDVTAILSSDWFKFLTVFGSRWAQSTTIVFGATVEYLARETSAGFDLFKLWCQCWPFVQHFRMEKLEMSATASKSYNGL